MQHTNWIQRGADGRPYYVRHKPALPSFRQIFAEAFRDIRSNNPFTAVAKTSAFQDQRQSTSEVTSTPSASRPKASNRSRTPRSKSRMRNSRSSTPQVQANLGIRTRSPPQAPQSQPQSQSQHLPAFFPIPRYPSFTGFPQAQATNHMNHEGANHQPTGHSNALVHYTAPHPRMYPYIAPGSQTLAMPPTAPPPNANGVPQGGPPIFQPSPQPGMVNSPSMGPMQIPAGFFPPNQDQEKPKCSECGRFRSARYRWKYPATPGKPVRPNICRRCRRIGTDSESGDADNSNQRYSRRKSLNRHRSRGRTSRPRSRARSSSQMDKRRDLDYYTSREFDRSSSSSDDMNRHRSKTGQNRYRRVRSSSNNATRYYDTPIAHSRSRPKKVVYLESPEDESEVEEIEVHQGRRVASGSIVIESRPPTPGTRAFTSQYVGSRPRAPIVIERREYFEEPSPPHYLQQSTSDVRFGSRNPYRNHRSSSVEDRGYRRTMDDLRDTKQFHETETDGTPRRRLPETGSRSRSHRRVSIDEGEESRLLYPPHHRAPSSPGRRDEIAPSSRLSHDNSVENAKDTRIGGKRSVQPLGQREQRSRSNRRRLQDEVAVADDYDWYDKDGMRVRVREI